MLVPSEELWKNTARRFQEKWNFPNCISVLDGKHVVIQAPANSGSHFYNYKGTFSVVLLALVEADYWFLAVDVGGSNGDGGIFTHSSLGAPAPSPLPSAPELGPVPFVIVADEVFSLKTSLLHLSWETSARGSPGLQLPPLQNLTHY